MEHSLALDATGAVWAWGRNQRGQLGDGTFEDRAVPVRVANLSGVIAVATEGVAGHSLALRSDGTVWAWGQNNLGQVGDGTSTDRAVPVQVPGLTGIVAIAVNGWQASYALAGDGTLWSWGSNVAGQLGDASAPYLGRSTPGPVPNLAQVIGIVAGDTHALAKTADGRLWSWGLNYAGQLGLGDLATRSSPTAIAEVSGVTAFFAGGDSSAVLAACELGCTADVPAIAEPAEVIQFAASTTTTSGCTDEPLFDWDFGDGTAHSSEQIDDHTYAEEGTFHWTLTVTANGASSTCQGDIVVAYACTVACSAAAPSVVQVDDPAAFIGSATASHCATALTFDWDFGDGSDHSILEDPTHAFATAGIYEWTLTVTANGTTCVQSGSITVLGPSCAGAYDLIISAAAHSNNAWQSDIDLYNIGAEPASVDIALLKPGQANLSPPAMNVAVLPGVPLRIPDILGSYLPAANAALGIRFCAGAALVNSRLYNIGTAKSGTFGTIVPALPPAAAITPSTRGVFHHLSYSPDPKAGHRVNLGFASASPFPISVTVRLYGDDGGLIGTKTLSVRAYEQSRLDSIHKTLGTGPVEHGALTVEVNTPNASLHAYALLIDNRSGDPAFMQVELVPR